MKASDTIEGYLHQIRASLHLDPGTEGRVVGELATYFEEKTAELEQEAGLDPEEAEQVAIRSAGPALDLARLMYAAHSRSSWLDVLLACQPHLFFAALCATHLWRRPVVAVGLYVITLFVSLLGWRRGRPTWIFPWIGYAFAPLLAGGLFFHGLAARAAGDLFTGLGGGEVEPTLGVAALLVALCGAGFWLLLAVAGRTIRRDWLLLSLATLPWTVVVLWLLHLEPSGALGDNGMLVDAAAVPPLLLLAGTSALFLRLRRRLHKAGILAVGAVVAALIMILVVEEGSSYGLLLWVSMVVLGLLFCPALVAAARRNGHAGVPGPGSPGGARGLGDLNDGPGTPPRSEPGG
jgi:hypothetical protein